MIGFVLRRLLQAVPTLFAVVTISFFLVRLAPGGPFDLERPLAPAAMAQRIREAVQRYGLAIDDGACETYAAAMGAEPFPFRFCPVTVKP